MRFRLVQRLAISILISLAATVQAESQTVEVRDSATLARAVRAARPGWRIRLHPGRYTKRVSVSRLRGTAEAPIVIEAVDPENPPHLVGGTESIHIRQSSYVVLRNLDISRQTSNGINIDDGGSTKTPSHHIVLDGLRIKDIGDGGNHDGIKLSGVQDFLVRDCSVEGCGGQGIDMVGCHRGIIEECMIRGKKGFRQRSGVQMKGGTREVTVRRCVLINAGDRAVNLGGSTGRGSFRPRDAEYEAADLTVEGCIIVGSQAPLAFTGVDGAVVRFNTIYLPDKWVLRILQESNDARFVPCRNGRFEHNLIYYRRAAVQTLANVGPHTQPKTFRFAKNLWFCEEQPKLGQVTLPTKELDGSYGIDPKFVDAKRFNFRPQDERAARFGAHAFRTEKEQQTDGNE